MVTIHDPVFADELMERWGKIGFDMVNLHASGELTPYRCKKIEIDISTGMKIGLCILINYESCGDDEQDIEHEVNFFEFDRNPANTVCYQGSEVMEYERLHSADLQRVALKPQGADARFYKPFWSNGVLTTLVEQDCKENEENKSGEERQERTALQEENERLKQELAQVRPPRTAAATEKAQLNHVENWKSHAEIMVKVSYELGGSSAKGLTRAEIEAVCERHGGLPSTPYELLRAALPEGVVKKDPGPKVKN